jgi:hypothetical protein
MSEQALARAAGACGLASKSSWSWMNRLLSLREIDGALDRGSASTAAGSASAAAPPGPVGLHSISQKRQSSRLTEGCSCDASVAAREPRDSASFSMISYRSGESSMEDMSACRTRAACTRMSRVSSSEPRATQRYSRIVSSPTSWPARAAAAAAAWRRRLAAHRPARMRGAGLPRWQSSQKSKPAVLASMSASLATGGPLLQWFSQKRRLQRGQRRLVTGPSTASRRQGATRSDASQPSSGENAYP